MLILVALIIVAAVVVGVTGIARSVGVPRGAVGGAGIAALLVLLVVAVLGGVGSPGSGSGDHASTPGAPPTTRRSEPTQGSRMEPAPADLPVIEVTATDTDTFAPDNVVGGLQPPGVVRVRASGFDAFERASVEQCVTELQRLPACTPAFPVQFGEDGRAEFQYRLHDSLPGGGCRWGRPTCELRVRGSASRRVGMAQTIFLDAPRRGRVIVDPSTDLRDGEIVRVSVTGFPPDVGANAMLCAPPTGHDPRRCGAAGGATTFRVDGEGSGQTDLQVLAAPLGTEGLRCGPRVPCVVSVVTDQGFVAAPVVPLRFSRGPGASYDPGRVAAGLSIAAVLTALGIALARRTDWRKPTEAATPDVDRADLETGLTLDELFGTDEELDASDAVQL